MDTKIFLMLLAATHLFACGAEMPSMPGGERERNSGDQENKVQEVVEPPLPYYERAMTAEFELIFGKSIVEDRHQLIFVNFNGGHVRQGYGGGASFLLCKDEVEVPGSGLGQEDIDDATFYVRNYFEQTYPGVTIAFKEPSGGSYTTVYVTSNYGVLGCGQADIKFHAPFDEQNLAYDDVAFVFAEKSKDLDDLVSQIETAAERTLGVKGQNPVIELGITPREKLKGLSNIHSMSRLLWELEEKDVMDISHLNGELEATVLGGLKHLNGFDRILTVTSRATSEPDQSSESNSGNSGSSGTGGLIGWLGDLLGIGGVGNNNGSGNGSGDQGSDSNDKGLESQIPRLDQLIEAENPESLSKMVANVRGHAVFVTEEYDDQTRQSLRSLLVVGYSQAFQSYMDLGINSKEYPSDP